MFESAFFTKILNELEVSQVNPIALRMAKTLCSFGHSVCNRVKIVNPKSLQKSSCKKIHTDIINVQTTDQESGKKQETVNYLSL